MSFFLLNNAFHDLPFGGLSRNIYGSTPIELLHAIELGLCEYIHESFELNFTTKEKEIIST